MIREATQKPMIIIGSALTRSISHSRQRQSYHLRPSAENSGERTESYTLMAAAFSIHTLSLSPVAPVTPTPSRILKSLTLALPLHHASGSSSSFPAFRTLGSSQCSRRSLRAALKVAAADPKKLNENEENQAMKNKSESVAGQNGNMMALTQAYKKAVLNGDEKSVSEIEALICILEKEMNALSLKTSELMSEIASGKDKLLRLNADFENFRKRSEKDRLSFTSDIRAEVIERLLPMVDNFEKVKQQTKPESEKEKKIDTSYQGIYRQFVEIMRSMRVSVVETVGRPFDPSIHEAIAREESEQFKSGIVMQELRLGFVLGDRVLRPASVKVSTGQGPGKASSADMNSTEQPAVAADSANTSSNS